MNDHPYLRAYMAGIAVPTPLLLVALTLFSVARFVYNVPIPVERVIIFPMAIIPNLFGVWNMLHLASRSHTHLPLGIHGAILPFVLAPAGFLLGHSLPCLLKFSHAVYGTAAGFQFVWPCHSHPHWQRTESLSLSFLIRALQIAHDLIHMAVLQRSDPSTKPVFTSYAMLDSRKSSYDAAQLSQYC